jgi:hypothetical protein
MAQSTAKHPLVSSPDAKSDLDVSRMSTVEFLQAITGGGPVNIVAIRPDAPKGTGVNGWTGRVDASSEVIAALPGQAAAKKANLYWALNEPKAKLIGKPGKWKEDDIAFLRGVAVDIDPLGSVEREPGGLARERERLLALAGKLTTGHCPASVAIDTGNGVQLIWLFDVPIENSPELRARVKALAVGLQDLLSGDSTQSVEHVFRLPGTRNFPDARKRAKGRGEAAVDLLHFDVSRRYALDQLEELAPPRAAASKASVDLTDFDYPAVLSAAEDGPDELPQPLRARVSELRERRGFAAALDNTDRSERDYALAAQCINIGMTDPTEIACVTFALSPDKLQEKEGRGQGDYYASRTISRALARTPHFEAIDGGTAAGAAAGSARTQEQGPHDPWPEPFDIFGDARPAQLSSPSRGSLPDVLERWSRSEARRKGVSEAFAAAAAVAVVAGAVGNGLTIQPRRQDTGWRVPSALWVSLVDQPGSGKSPVIAAALKPLNDLDAERRKAAAAQAMLEQAARAAEPKGRKGQSPAKPVPRSLVDNTTMEKLVSLLAENPRGLLQKPDELASLFGALGAYKKSGEGDRGQLLRLYDGGSITVDRQGSGTTHAENALLSILSGTQPDRIGKVARELGSDGMLQRFLFVLGDEIERGGGVDEAPDEPAERDYHELVRYLATAELRGRAPVVLSDEAHSVLTAAEGRIRALKHCPGVPGAWAEHVAKWNGTLYRITLAFHAVECWRAWSIVDGVFPEFYPQPVSGDTARRAALFSSFLLRHALAFYQRFFEHGATGKDARRFAGFILTAPDKTTYSRRDVGQAIRELRDRRQLYLATRELEDIGWLRAAARDAEGVSKWEVNPAVHVRFADRAQWEIEERRAKRESIALATETRRNWLGSDGEA